jgi:hypothetical protein
MTRTTVRAAALLAAFGSAGVGAAQPPADPLTDALLRRAQAIKPTPAELRWQQIPWLIDPDLALRQARAERRPIFLWVAGGRDRDGLPLEKC